MKKLILILLCCSAHFYAQQDWVWQNPLPFGKTLYALTSIAPGVAYAFGDAGAAIKTDNGGVIWQVLNTGGLDDFRATAFSDVQTGFAAGRTGVVYKTTDGGLSFQKLQTGTTLDLNAICIPAPGTVICAGEAGLLLKSSDNGATWQMSFPDTVTFNAVYFSDAQNGWMSGASGVIMKTLNGGSTWQKVASGIMTPISSLDFHGTIGMAAGFGGMILRSADAGATWQQVTPAGEIWYQRIQVVSASTAYACGSNGSIIKTTDAGATWQTLNTGSPRGLQQLAFTSEQEGWIVGDRGLIVKTTDGGTSWDFQSSGSADHFNGIEFTPSGNGWVVGDKGALLRSSNGGEDWYKIPMVTNRDLNDVAFIADSDAVVVGDYATVLRTEDAGNTWFEYDFRSMTVQDFLSIDVTSQASRIGGVAGTYLGYYWNFGIPTGWNLASPGHFNTIRSILTFSPGAGLMVGDNGTIVRIRLIRNSDSFFVRSQPVGDLYDACFIGSTVWAVGEQGVVLKSQNQGDTWTQIAQLPVNWLRTVHFVDANTGYTAGSNGKIFKTTDGGTTWVNLKSGITTTITGIYFSGPSNGWAIGRNGMILRTYNGGGSGSPLSVCEYNEQLTPNDFVLEQNYPNPFNPGTSITFTLKQAAPVQVRVFTPLGESVAIVTDGEYAAGTHTIYFDASQLSSGVYFYSMVSGGKTSVRKMVLLR